LQNYEKTMMLKRFLNSSIVYLCLLYTDALQINYTEVIPNKHSVNYLVNHLFIENLKEEKFSNMVIYNNKDDKRKTKILYSGKKFGYAYTGQYEIEVKSPTCALIQYENNFVLNKTILERIDDDSIKITIELDTSYPIPERLLRLMIRQKLYYLRTH